MDTKIDTRVSMALHPQNVDALDPDGVEAGILEPTRNAFALAYTAIARVHEARAVASNDPSMNENSVTIKVADLAEREMAKVTREFDGVRNRLLKGIAALEADLHRPVETQGAALVSAEVRAHIAKMPASQRIEFLRKRIQAGDRVTAGAALGAPGYLSGIEDAMQQTLTRFYHERNSPETARRLKAMEAARDLIERNAPLAFREVEKAVGQPSHKVRALREAASKTKAALA